MSLPVNLQVMLDKARRYLVSAALLREAGDYDSAVSRLYYAMFYAAEAALFSKDLTFSSHSAVISAFAVQFIKTDLLPRHLHKWLNEAFGLRQISDYMFDSSPDKANLDELQNQAEQFIDAIEQFLAKAAE